MRHDTVGSRENKVSKLTRWQEVDNPLFNFIILHVKTWANDTTLVEASRQFNHNLVGTMIVDNFKFPNVTYICEKENAMCEKCVARTTAENLYCIIRFRECEMSCSSLLGLCTCIGSTQQR